MYFNDFDFSQQLSPISVLFFLLLLLPFDIYLAYFYLFTDYLCPFSAVFFLLMFKYIVAERAGRGRRAITAKALVEFISKMQCFY